MWPDPNLPGQERLGWAVSFVGDFNGDGADDFVLSAPYDSASGYPAMIYFFYGPRTQGNLVGFTITTSNTYNVGWHVAGGFDLNADGYDDIAISGGQRLWRAFVLFGSPNFIANNVSEVNIDDFGSTGLGMSFQDEINSRMTGYSVAPAGDFDGDGYKDLLIGSPFMELVLRFYGPFFDAGMNVAGGGDFNGDGLDDIVILPDRWNSLTGYLVYGVATRPTSWIYLNDLDGSAGFKIAAPANDWFGQSAALGDWNGDGKADLAIGLSQNSEIVCIAFGTDSTAWTDALSLASQPTDGVTFMKFYTIAYGCMGYSIGNAGDINGDGIADLAFGNMWGFGEGNTLFAGNVFVYFGHNKTWPATSDPYFWTAAEGVRLNGVSGYRYLGGALSPVPGDMNNDGVNDVLIGAPHYQGACSVLFGRPIYNVTAYAPTTKEMPICRYPHCTSYDIFGQCLQCDSPGLGITIGTGTCTNCSLVNGFSPDGNTTCTPCTSLEPLCLSCDPVDGACFECPAGFGPENGVCVNCSLAPNTWSNDTEICQTCVMNGCLECDAGSGICTKCPAGTGINDTAPVTCNTCTSTMFSPDGTQCDACLLGFGCISCNATNGLCTECPAGMHLDGVSCEDCGDMQWSAGGSAATCSACPVDAACEECDSRTGHCTSCPAAHGLDDTGCTACGGTQFSDGKHACAACELQDGCSACDRTTGMCIACPAGTGLQGVGCVACTPTKFVVDGYCSPCALDDGCIACDPVTGACVDCPGDMVPTGTGCKPLKVASNATKDDDDNVSMAAKPTTNALHLIASTIIVAIATAAMAVF